MAISKRAGSATGAEYTSADLLLAKADITGLANGDLVLVHLNARAGLWSNADGFQIIEQQLSFEDNSPRVALAYKFMTDVSSEPANWTFTANAAAEKAAVANAWVNVDADIFSTEIAKLWETGSTTSANPPIQTNAPGDVVIIEYHSSDAASGGGYVPGAPSGYTAAGSSESNTTDTAYVEVAYKVVASPGLETPGVWTRTGAAYRDNKRTFTLRESGASPTRAHVVPGFAAEAVEAETITLTTADLPLLKTGDVIVASIGTFARNHTPPAGWVTLLSEVYRDLFYRIVTDIGTEPATHVFTDTPGGGVTEKGMVAFAIRGLDTDSPIDAALVLGTESERNEGAVDLITTVTDGAIVIASNWFADTSVSASASNDYPISPLKPLWMSWYDGADLGGVQVGQYWAETAGAIADLGSFNFGNSTTFWMRSGTVAFKPGAFSPPSAGGDPAKNIMLLGM